MLARARLLLGQQRIQFSFNPLTAAPSASVATNTRTGTEATMAPANLKNIRALEAPIVFEGEVLKGFGRGGKLLGCPTANLDGEKLQETLLESATGVYFGWARLRGEVYKMVASIGYNPYFKDVQKKTIEPHLLYKFEKDFYGENLKILVCGYIRPEMDFNSLQELKDAIKNDIEVGKLALDQEKYTLMKAML